MKNILLLIALCSLAACSSQPSDTSSLAEPTSSNSITLSPAQQRNANILTGPISLQNINETLRLNGKIDVPPQNTVSISVPLGGYLRSTHLLQGAHVRKGQVIAVVEDQQYIQLQQDYLLATAQLLYAQQDYDRQHALNASQASSNKVLQLAQAQLATLQVSQQALAQKLLLIGIQPSSISASHIARSINIYAPIDGFVSLVNANIGKYIAPTDILFQLIDPSDIHLALQVFEKDIPKLAIGQRLQAYTNNQPDSLHPCTIILIARNLSSQGIAEVHCHFDDYDPALLPGTYMNARIAIASSRSPALPTEAIVQYQGQQYIFVADSSHSYSLVPVSVAGSHNGYTALASLPPIGSRPVVLRGAYTLLMALKNTADE